jgi:hypothetical protein
MIGSAVVRTLQIIPLSSRKLTPYNALDFPYHHPQLWNRVLVVTWNGLAMISESHKLVFCARKWAGETKHT